MTDSEFPIQTANWAVTVVAAFLTVVFSQPNLAAFILLIGIPSMCGFLLFEVRRYRTYGARRRNFHDTEVGKWANR